MLRKNCLVPLTGKRSHMRWNYSAYRKCARIRRFSHVSLPRAFPVERLIALGPYLALSILSLLSPTLPQSLLPFPLAFLSILENTVLHGKRSGPVWDLLWRPRPRPRVKSICLVLLNSLIHPRNKASRAHWRIKLIWMGLRARNRMRNANSFGNLIPRQYMRHTYSLNYAL